MAAVSDLNGMFKQVYGPEIIEPLPSDGTLAKAIKFVPQEYREGKSFHFPVVLGHEHGITFSAANDAYALNDPESAVSEEASIEVPSFTHRANISYDAASKALSGKGKERVRAYINATRFKMRSLMRSAEFYRELSIMYGVGTGAAAGSNIGAVSARTADADTVQTFSLSRATWAGGLWANMRNAFVDVYASNGTTHRNPTGTMKVTGMNLNTCEIQFTGTEAEMDNITAGDIIVPRGARTAQCVGVEMILRNTGALFGINAATHPVWRSARHNVDGGTLNFDTVINGLAQLGEMGLDEGLQLYISHRTFPDLLSDLATLRRYLGARSKSIQQGASEISYDTQTGPVSIKVHKYMKQGQAWGMPLSTWKRTGSTDVAFGVPGSNDNFFSELPSHAGFQLRCYSRQGPICEEPAKSIEFYGIQNSGDSLPAT